MKRRTTITTAIAIIGLSLVCMADNIIRVPVKTGTTSSGVLTITNNIQAAQAWFHTVKIYTAEGATNSCFVEWNFEGSEWVTLGRVDYTNAAASTAIIGFLTEQKFPRDAVIRFRNTQTAPEHEVIYDMRASQ